MVTFTSAFNFFIWFWVSVYNSFIWARSTHLSISFIECMLAKNSFSLKNTWQYLIFFLIFEGCFTGDKILGWHSFGFSTLNMLSHCLLTSMVSDEESAFNLNFDLLLWWVNFLLMLSRFCFSLECSIGWLWCI